MIRSLPRISSRSGRCSLACASALLLGASGAFAAPPTLSDIDIPTQIIAGSKQIFRVGYKDPDGDAPRKFVCVVQGPGGIQRKEYTAVPGADARRGLTAEFPMGPFDVDGQYSISFEADSGDGQVKTPLQRFVVINITRRYIELAVGLLVSLIAIPAVVFLFTRMLSRNGDPRKGARLGLLCGIFAAYAWYVYLFGALHQGVGIAAGAILLLAAIVAIFSGTKSNAPTSNSSV